MIIFISLGFIACLFQLVILRELTFAIAKNELAFVTGVGAWLIGVSLGSLAKTVKKRSPEFYPPLICLIFCLSVSAIHLAKSLIGLKYYEAVSLTLALLTSGLFVTPVGFIVGFAFTDFVQRLFMHKPEDKNIYAKFFAFEAMGFFAAGIIFTFLLCTYSNPFIFAIFSLLLLTNLKNSRRKIACAGLTAIIWVVFCLSFNPILNKEFNGAKIISHIGTKYGPLIITEKNSLQSIFASGSLLATSEDKAANEEFIHMGFSPLKPGEDKQVLFIGPALSYEIEEMLKHKVMRIDCLEINPEVSALARHRLPESLKRKVNFISNDPRLYLKKTAKRYDIILMNMPPPASLYLNRYYTAEFFKLASQRLKERSVFVFSIPSKREILSPQIASFNSSIINSLQYAFKFRRLIPGDNMLIIATNYKDFSDSELLNNYRQAKIKTQFFSIYLFKDYLDAGIRDYLESRLNKNIEANSDLVFCGFFNYLLLEQLKFYPWLRIDILNSRKLVYLAIALITALLAGLGLRRRKMRSLINIYVAGFISILSSSILFVLFQLYSGALFWKAGLLIGLFMAGLSLGVFMLRRINYKPFFLSRLYTGWALCGLILLLSLKRLDSLFYADNFFYAYSLLCGLITGAAYPLLTAGLLANKITQKNIAPITYSADLLGAFCGTLAAAIVLLPMLGVAQSLATSIILASVFTLINLVN
jgi:spermidine synthase